MAAKVKRAPLTVEQQQLVTDNMNLIYKVLSDMGYAEYQNPERFNEDWYGVAAIGLCLAASLYKPETGVSFCTYAYNTIWNEISKAQTKNKRLYQIPEDKLCYGESLVLNDSDCDSTLFDMIPGNEKYEPEIVLEREIFYLLDELKADKRLRYVVIRSYEGYSSSEIAKKIGVSRTTVRHLLQQFYIKVQDYQSGRKVRENVTWRETAHCPKIRELNENDLRTPINYQTKTVSRYAPETRIRNQKKQAEIEAYLKLQAESDDDDYYTGEIDERTGRPILIRIDR